jgi:hypothetical protein
VNLGRRSGNQPWGIKAHESEANDREIASATFLFKIAVVEVCFQPVPTELVIARSGFSRSTRKRQTKILSCPSLFTKAST